MPLKPQIVLGTGNPKKRRELGRLFEPLGIELRTLADYPPPIEIVEDGRTFAENAALKAVGQARHLGRWVLAEDSGLAVDALGGAPGVYSARYSGPEADDETNNRKLLDELDDTPLAGRTARFVCQMILADPAGEVRLESVGACRGRIQWQMRGRHGFGYDPLFEIVEYHRTFAELGPRVKAALSHRARAARQIIPGLLRLVDSGCIG